MPYYIENTLSKIDNVSPKLENVASLLSSGNDTQAMEIVADFSDIMEECIQIFAFKDNPTETVNQDFFEMLISFIISQRKNIPAPRSVEKDNRIKVYFNDALLFK